jgi:hypothetical protein
VYDQKHDLDYVDLISNLTPQNDLNVFMLRNDDKVAFVGGLTAKKNNAKSRKD